ncbi:MAG: phosphate uptake regulator PhoU [Methanomicrobiales archaeon]|nr:phosphate uptake regulator PhoU [Methanomicrobiales archaeon]
MTGGSSYVISLPKDWIQSMNIKKNEPLQIKIQSDGSLLILPHPSEAKGSRVKEFKADRIQNPTFLFRCLVGAYIAGHTTIRVTSSTRLSPPIRKAVRDFSSMSIGQQIVEETDFSIVIKDILNPAEMPFANSVKRMYVIVETMYNDAMTALETRDKQLAEDVVNRDIEVDKLQWLVARQYHLMLNDPALAEKMQVSAGEALNYFVVSRILERIGDHGVRVAKHIPILIDHQIDRTIVSDMNDATRKALDVLSSSMRSLFSASITNANRTIDMVKDLEKMTDEISSIAYQKKGVLAISIGYMAESIRRAGEYGCDISESIINQLINEEQ